MTTQLNNPTGRPSEAAMRAADQIADIEGICIGATWPKTCAKGVNIDTIAHIIDAEFAQSSLPAVSESIALSWSAISEPNDACCYTHTIAETPFGRFLLTWKGWKESMDCGFDETPWGDVVYLGWNTVESAQAWAASEMARRIKLCNEPAVSRQPEGGKP